MLTSLTGKMNISPESALFPPWKGRFCMDNRLFFRLFQLYIFLYSAIHKEDTDFRSRISACTCQRVEICDSRDVENAKCQKAAIAFVMFLSVYAAQQEHLRYPPRLLPIVPKDKGHLFSGSISGEPVSCSSS